MEDEPATYVAASPMPSTPPVAPPDVRERYKERTRLASQQGARKTRRNLERTFASFDVEEEEEERNAIRAKRHKADAYVKLHATSKEYTDLLEEQEERFAFEWRRSLCLALECNACRRRSSPDYLMLEDGEVTNADLHTCARGHKVCSRCVLACVGNGASTVKCPVCDDELCGAVGVQRLPLFVAPRSASQCTVDDSVASRKLEH